MVLMMGGVYGRRGGRCTVISNRKGSVVTSRKKVEGR